MCFKCSWIVVDYLYIGIYINGDVCGVCVDDIIVKDDYFGWVNVGYVIE